MIFDILLQIKSQNQSQSNKKAEKKSEYFDCIRFLNSKFFSIWFSFDVSTLQNNDQIENEKCEELTSL